MNNYVTLDGKRYIAPHGGFFPMRNKPATERITLSGASDITFGSGTMLEWIGMLIAPVTPIDSNWGDIDDLRATLEKRQGLGFTDFYGVATTVYAMDKHAEESISPMWDAATNEIRFTVRLIVDQAGGLIVVCDSLILAATSEDLSTSGGALTVALDELTLASSAEYAYTSRPVMMQELQLVSGAYLTGIPQVVVMDELTLAGSAETSSVT
jgi:hypothetical protein